MATGGSPGKNMPEEKKAGQQRDHKEGVDDLARRVGGLNLRAKPNSYSKAEMKTLLEQALYFVKDWHFTCEYIYRNKSHEYFKDIRDRSGIMDPLTKDRNGDPRNPINRVLPGIFFCANVSGETEKPPSVSPFGPRRILIKINALLTKDLGLYFSDFYCNYSNQHYVQLVLVPESSVWKSHPILERLVKLDIEDNPFFSRVLNADNHEYIWKVSSKAWVEIFYVDSIDIEYLESRGEAEFVDTATNKHGKTVPGIVKTPTCRICNL